MLPFNLHLIISPTCKSNVRSTAVVIKKGTTRQDKETNGGWNLQGVGRAVMAPV